MTKRIDPKWQADCDAELAVIDETDDIEELDSILETAVKRPVRMAAFAKRQKLLSEAFHEEMGWI